MWSTLRSHAVGGVFALFLVAAPGTTSAQAQVPGNPIPPSRNVPAPSRMTARPAPRILRPATSPRTSRRRPVSSLSSPGRDRALHYGYDSARRPTLSYKPWLRQD